jgi:septal ring-binding cell division protein DamX
VRCSSEEKPEDQVAEAQDEAKLTAEVETEKPVESNKTAKGEDKDKDKEESADASPAEVPEPKKFIEPKEEEKTSHAKILKHSQCLLALLNGPKNLSFSFNR